MKAEERANEGRSIIGQWAMVFALLLGITLWIKDGTASGPGQMDWARTFLLITTGVGTLAAFRRKTLGLECLILKFIIGGLIILSGALTLVRPPGYDVAITGLEDYQNWILLRGMATGLFLAAFFSEQKIQKLLLLIGICFLTGSLYWTISHAKNSTIDVVHVFRAATKYLENGENPYAKEMPQIYPENSPLRHKDPITGNPLTFGFVYPLGTLSLGAFGEVIFGDYRLLFALIFLSGLSLLICMPPFRTGLIYLFPILLFPRLELIFERGWADGISSGLCLWTSALISFLPWIGSIFFCVFLATKPYFLIFWIAPFLAVPNLINKHRLCSLIILVLPLLLYLLPALQKPDFYFWSIFFINTRLPPRFDSLSFFPFWNSIWGWICLTSWMIGFGRQLIFTVKSRLMVELIPLLNWFLFGVFLFAKSAFMNYYFNIIVFTSLLIAFLNSKQRKISD